MAKICVFCSSSENGISESYRKVARETGKLLGEDNHHLIYGGSHRGLMGEVSKTFAKYNNEITEIIPKMWENVIVEKENAIITENLGERLQKMQDYSDAFITLPGGFGSLQETLDVLVAKQLNLHQKPFALVNTNEFYNSLLAQIKKTIYEGFAPKDNHLLLEVVDTPKQALEYIENYTPIKISDKIHD